MFYIGQKIVCVDASPRSLHSLLDGLTKDKIYTVRSVDFRGIKLAEIYRSELRRHGVTKEILLDCPYHASRFRPLVEKKTDISVFQELLKEHEAV